MWLTSKRPALVRTAMCSGMMPAYSTGISQPQNSIILPPSFLWSSLKRVFFMGPSFLGKKPKIITTRGTIQASQRLVLGRRTDLL